jgi:hypothetical protein
MQRMARMIADAREQLRSVNLSGVEALIRQREVLLAAASVPVAEVFSDLQHTSGALAAALMAAKPAIEQSLIQFAAVAEPIRRIVADTDVSNRAAVRALHGPVADYAATFRATQEQLTASLRSSFAGLGVAADVTNEIADSFPEPPSQVTPQSVGDWGRDIWRWAADAINLLDRTADAPKVALAVTVIGVLLSLLLALQSGRDNEAMERRIVSEIRSNGVAHTVAVPMPSRLDLAITTRRTVVRSEPNSGSTALARLPVGTAVVVIRCEHHWCQCEYRDAASVYQQGWVYQPFLTFFAIAR